MVISVTSSMIDVFTIALLTAEFGQVWAKLGLRKSCTTLGEIARLHNCAVTIYSKLPDMRPLDDITPQLWHDVTPQQRLKCKENGRTS